MTGRKQSYYARVGRGLVVVETLMQRRRDAEQARREQRDGEEYGEEKST